MKKWIDETGLELPANRITPLEKARERATTKLAKKATNLSLRLCEFKKEAQDLCEDLWRKSLEAAGADEKTISKSKGNHTFYNFDRSIKVEVKISERIDFDDALIEAAKAKFDDFLSNSTNTTDEVIRALINDAFSTSHGNLDTKKVLGLMRHRQRIPVSKYPSFHEALNLIEQSIRRPDSRQYTRIWERDEEGQYQNIDLNFSSI